MDMYDNLTHAYIVAGERGDADNLAAAMVCGGTPPRPCGVCAHCKKSSRGIHPDIEVIAPADDKTQVPIERVRAVVRAAYIVPNEADCRVFIFDGADTALRADAQNALLKLLEEPPRHVRFILRADEPDALLPTVRSRCRVLRLPMREDVAGEAVSRLADGLFTAMTRGAADVTRFSFELEKMPRGDFPAFIAEARRRVAAYSRELTVSASAPLTADALTRLLRVLTDAEKYLTHNVGAAHIAAKICAELC